MPNRWAGKFELNSLVTGCSGTVPVKLRMVWCRMSGLSSIQAVKFAFEQRCGPIIFSQGEDIGPARGLKPADLQGSGVLSHNWTAVTRFKWCGASRANLISFNRESIGMAVTVICPNLRCRTLLQVPEGTRGKRVRCGRCGKDFLIPAKPTAKKPAKPDAATEPGSDKTESAKK